MGAGVGKVAVTRMGRVLRLSAMGKGIQHPLCPHRRAGQGSFELYCLGTKEEAAGDRVRQKGVRSAGKAGSLGVQVGHTPAIVYPLS